MHNKAKSPVLKVQLKLHKPDIPIRRVINNISAPEYKVVKFLAKILNETVELQNQYAVSNSTDTQCGQTVWKCQQLIVCRWLKSHSRHSLAIPLTSTLHATRVHCVRTRTGGEEIATWWWGLRSAKGGRVTARHAKSEGSISAVFPNSVFWPDAVPFYRTWSSPSRSEFFTPTSPSAASSSGSVTDSNEN